MDGPEPNRLKRELGIGGATMMGLGSMVGTGVFVSIGIAAGVAGPAVILAIILAAGVATCNALSSAQLAASHAVSGGTYEYGYRYLNPALGFTAGWVFLYAKSASAVTAAIGFAGYFLRLVGGSLDNIAWVAVTATALLTLLVLTGMRRSSWANIAIVSVTLLALGSFVAFGIPTAVAGGDDSSTPFFTNSDGSLPEAFLYVTALMFVAFTGYGRIASLVRAEEAHGVRIRVLNLAEDATYARIVREHTAILDAIEAHDPARAATAVRGHLNNIHGFIAEAAAAHPDYFTDAP